MAIFGRESQSKEYGYGNDVPEGNDGYGAGHYGQEDVREPYVGDAVGSHSAIDPDSGVKRGLKNRHLSMMALAGIIGPGLLVGAGGALSDGGPASLIIGFGVIGMYTSSLTQPSCQLPHCVPFGM
jgi:amino acid transporter